MWLSGGLALRLSLEKLHESKKLPADFCLRSDSSSGAAGKYLHYISNKMPEM